MGGLSADLVHGSIGAGEVGFVVAVGRLLCRHAFPDQLGNIRVAASLSDDGPRVPLGCGEEAISELTFRSNSQPIAGIAKRLRDRVDKTDTADAVRESIVDGWLARIGSVGRREGAEASFDLRPNLVAAGDGLGMPVLFRVEWHEFDKPQFKVVLTRVFDQRNDFMFGEAFDGDGIEANLVETSLLCCADAVQDALQAFASRDPLKSRLTHSIKANIETSQASLFQLLRVVGQQDSICRQRDILNSVDLGKPFRILS